MANRGYFGAPHWAYFLVGSLFATLLFGSCAYACAKLSDASTEQAEKINPGVPLTRANTADLPAPDSLVRASSEPLQAQESVLLRAATEKGETPPEQLVRASVGQE